MFSHLPIRGTKLLALISALFLAGFLVLSYLLGLSYADDRMQLAGNHPGAAGTAAISGELDSNARLEMQIRLALRHQAALEKLLSEQQNPASANYHKWLKSGEFFQRFGPAQPEVNALIEWLTSEGFEVERVSAGYLEFSGSVEQVQRTFAVKIARFGAADAYGNIGDPFIPTRFAKVIGAITGMDNMTHAMPIGQRMNAASVDPNAVVGSAQAFGPTDFYNFYDATPAAGSDGAGDCIAIVGTSDFLDSALSAYTDQFGIAPISYTRELHGANPGINGAEIEAEIDLEWAHTAAPGAAITFHLGGDLVDDITGAVTDNQCGAISISYGFCGPSAAFINGIIHPLFQQAAAQGQSVFVSSDDEGAAGLGYDAASNQCVLDNSPSVNEMSADPNVTSVGGTQFTPKFAGGIDEGFSTESVWNDGSGASGGGASQVFAKPTYQTGPGIPDDGARDVPDISLMASPSAPGAFVGHDVSGVGQVVCCVGGTSLSAPLWAGLSRAVAEVAGQARLGNLSTIIYQLANQRYATAGFRAVTNGNNGFNGLPGFNAGPGYDQATGWGTVDFEIFANAVNELLNPAAAATPTLTPTATLTPSAAPTPTPSPVGGELSAPRSIAFPATATGRPGTMKTLTIRNLSRSKQLSVDVSGLAAPFGLSGAGPYSVAPMSSVAISILFSPAQCGTVSQALHIVSSDPRHPTATVKVSARVVGGKLSAPASIALHTPMNTIVTRTVMLKNSGAGILEGTAQAFGSNSPFTLLGGSVSFWLAAGQAQAVTIQFQAASVGTAEATLVIATAEPIGSATMSVTGTSK